MKVKSIKMNEYFKIKTTKDQLSYLKIIPHQSTRNYKSIEIAKVINRCYKEISKRFYKDHKYWIYEVPTKVAYYIYISEENGVEFFLIVPTLLKKMFIEKLSLTWGRVEVQEVEDIPRFSYNSSKLGMEYTRVDALSLNIIDKKSNEILESQLNVIDMMQEGDKVGIYYNFNYKNPYRQLGFKTNYNKAMDKIKEGKSIDKIKTDNKSLLKVLLRILMVTGEELMASISELLGEKKKSKKTDMDTINKTLGILQKKDLSKYTKDKAQLEVISTQILLMSESKNKDNENMNINSLSQSFNTLDGDNELRPKMIGIKRRFNLDNSKLPIPSIDMSIEEVGTIITQPGKELIKKYDIKANSINEEKVPNICKEGYICTGIVGKKQEKAYLNPNPDQDTGLAVTGKQGSGKTEGLKNYSNDCIKHGDSLIILDYIGNNDLANTVEKIVPSDKLVLKDLSKVECMESIAYNEKYYTDDMNIMDKLDIISEKSQLITQLINSFNFGQDLTSAMRRFFVSAANITYAVNQHASFREIIDCLEFYDARMKLISNVPDEFKSFCDKHIRNLLKLNDKYSKGDLKGEDNGETCESKIERILDRVSVMAESPRLEYMLQKNVLDNINFEDCFNKGKVIVIKMRPDKFGSEHMKNMLTLYFVTRIWEACVNRYSKSNGDELKRVHFIIDEPHQVPIVTSYLKPLLTQMRKYRLKPIFATQSLLQLEHILDDLKGAGFSYMILAGSDKVNYNLLKDELLPYEVNDLLTLERFHSLNLIPDENGVLKPFITKLPPKIKTTTLLQQSKDNKSNIIDFQKKIG